MVDRSLREHVEAATLVLAQAGVDRPHTDAEWLLAAVLDVPRLEVYLDPDPLPAATARRYAEAVRRRARREPLQQIIGSTDFRGLPIAVSPDVLVPRPETEMLVEYALALLPPPDGRRRRVVDLGTGSGCIAGAVAAARPDVEVVAIDLSPAAARLARDNAGALGLADRVAVVAGDLLEPVRGPVDLVVANPPYCSTAMLATLPPEVRDHEPRMALDGGPDGLAVTRRIVASIRRVLSPTGAVIIETAGAPQVQTVAAWLAAAGFDHVTIRADLGGRERFVSGVAVIAHDARRSPVKEMV